ncbi:MAG: hypothetical protein JKY48_15320 [Flavobacteriales bacterium]|nr:hypothetical protein [Flavobacteriales bacterium]
MSSIQEFIFFLPNLFLLLVGSYVIKNYPQFKAELRVISWFIFLSLIFQIPSYILGLFGNNNLPFLHFYTPLSFVCLTVFYQRVFRQFVHPSLLWWIMGFFVLFSCVNTIFWQELKSFNSYALSLESVLIIIYSLSLFTLLLDASVREEKRELLSSLVWINSGLLIYHTSGLLLFYFGDLLTHFTTVKFRISWIFHSFIYFVLFVCIIIGLWKHPKK